MLKDYRTLTSNIKQRLNPDDSPILTKAFNEEISSLAYTDARQFVRAAMIGVSEDYTRRSKEAGEKVKEHLNGSLSDVSFRYQGSVMTNTHIKGYSDIDLLVISEKSYSYDASTASKYINNPNFRQKLWENQVAKLIKETEGEAYSGNQLLDLLTLRLDSEKKLNQVYTDCDTSKSKSIRIRNKNIGRDVDVVIASWYDDVRSIIYDKGINRGVQIYMKDEHQKGNPDFPFISIDRINMRGSETEGRLKRMIRFLKNVKQESDLNIELSSFDINAICYAIDVSHYKNSDYLDLIRVICRHLIAITTDSDMANSITSVDDREYIFKDNPSKLVHIRNLLAEVNAIYQDINKIPLYS